MAKRKDEELELTEADEIGSEARVYELGFHLDPELPTEEVKKAYQAIRSQIAEKGTVVAESETEKIPLAYTISRQETSGRRDFNSAYFSWIAYEAAPEKHAEVVSGANAEKRIIRFVDLVTTKDAARHALEARELSRKAPEQESEPEAVSSVELDAALDRAGV